MSEEKIQKESHFKDFVDVHHIFDEAERLPGRDGTPGKGMKAREAMDSAECWWNIKGRFSMPDYGKQAAQMVVKSGVMMGLPWQDLDKQEKLRIVMHWYVHIGIETIIDARSTSDDSHAQGKKTGDLRKEGTAVLPILSTDSTHTPVNDKIESETWAEGYAEIEAENKPKVIIDDQ